MRLAIAALLLVAVHAAADEIPVPALGYVVDQAGLLSAEEEKALGGRLLEIEKSDGTQIAILTIASLEGKEAIEGYANRVFNTWKLGSAKDDNGVLVLVSVGDRAARIEVGEGLEGRLTDTLSLRILDDAKPSFRAGDWYGGLTQVTEKVLSAVRGEYRAEPASAATPGSADRAGPWIATAVLFGFLALVVYAISSVSWIGGLVAGGLLLTPFTSALLNAITGIRFSGWGIVPLAITLAAVGFVGRRAARAIRTGGTPWYAPGGRSRCSPSRSSSWGSSSRSWSSSSSGSSFRSGGGGRSSGGGATSRW